MKDSIIEALDNAIREKIHGVRTACMMNFSYMVLSCTLGIGMLLMTPATPLNLNIACVLTSLLPLCFGLYCAKEFINQLRWVIASIGFEKHLH